MGPGEFANFALTMSMAVNLLVCAHAHVPLMPGGSGEIHTLPCRGHFFRWKEVCWGEGIMKETLSLSVMF